MAQIRYQGTVETLLVANPSDTILFFTNLEKVYAKKAQHIPTANPVGQGTPATQVLNISSSEKITAAIAVSSFERNEDLIMLTREGRMKRTHLDEFASIRSSGLNVGAKIGWAQSVRNSQELIVVSRYGQAIRFKTNDVRPVGRTAAGVSAIRLRGRDEVAGMDVIAPKASLLVVTTYGFAKHTPLSEYHSQSRGGSGMRTLTDNIKKTGEVVAAYVVSNQDDVILISRNGMLLRTAIENISQQGRTTQGKRTMELIGNDVIASVVVLASI